MDSAITAALPQLFHRPRGEVTMASKHPHRPIAIKLVLASVLMFAFAVFAMPPLYSLFCEITGVGLQPAERYQAVSEEVDTSRTVLVQFLASNAANMPWEFYPKKFEIAVHPGERSEISYYAHNRTRRDMVAQAIPNLSPANAVSYFHKTECFCFNQQELKAGEEAELKLIFIVDKEVPKTIDKITLSYTLFNRS